MLGFEETITNVLHQAGHMTIKYSDLKLDDKNLCYNVFLPTVREYERYRPPEETDEITVFDNQFILPKNTIHVSQIYPKS